MESSEQRTSDDSDIPDIKHWTREFTCVLVLGNGFK